MIGGVDLLSMKDLEMDWIGISFENSRISWNYDYNFLRTTLSKSSYDNKLLGKNKQQQKGAIPIMWSNRGVTPSLE